MKSNAKQSVPKKDYTEIAKDICGKMHSAVHPFIPKIGRLSFWKTALICLVFRLFVVFPLGQILALTVGCIWMYRNISMFKFAVLKGLWCAIGLFGGYEKKSLWFDHEGKNTILSLVEKLSAQGISYCNLNENMEDMPPASHWYAISSELNNMGILTQMTGNTFYISWHLPQRNNAASNPR